MKKRITLLTTGVLCAISVAVGAVVSDTISDIKAQLRPDFTIEIDGEVKTFKNANGETVYPVLYEGTTYLPVRAIGEIMGKTVFWHENEKRVELRESTVTDADVIVGDLGTTHSGGALGRVPAENKNTAVDKASFIGEQKAKEIALAKAGIASDGVIFDRVELYEDDGVWHYEVEFRKGFREYDADIAATDGRIISWETDFDD